MADNTKSTASEIDSNLDSRLLNPFKKKGQETSDLKNSDSAQSGDSSSRAGDLRERKKNKSGDQSASATHSLREKVMSAKRQEQSRADKKGGVGKAVATPMRRGTSSLLRSAWINLIPSCGLTVIWINIHVFLGKVIGNNFFCKLGEEWMDRPGAAGKNNQATEKAGKAIGTFESMGLGCVNLGCLMILLLIFAIFYLLYYLIEKSIGVIIEFPAELASILEEMWAKLFN
jgi:hypothetical protein